MPVSREAYPWFAEARPREVSGRWLYRQYKAAAEPEGSVLVSVNASGTEYNYPFGEVEAIYILPRFKISKMNDRGKVAIWKDICLANDVDGVVL